MVLSHLLHTLIALRAISALPSPTPIPTPIPTLLIGFDTNNTSVSLPLIGLGTWQYNNTIAYQSTCKAFRAGYTFVDTAYGYGNQLGVGRAIKDCWEKPRNELFVMTKLPGGLNSTEVQFTHRTSLEELGLDYVDHLMTHFPSDWQETNASPSRRQEEWMALEEIYYRGEARSIGVSHYCERHLRDVMEVATVVPAVNQVEYHVGSNDVDGVMEVCRELGIAFMSFTPLCGPCDYDAEDSLINGDLVAGIAARIGKNVTGSQVALRYIVQQGIPVIPKSNSMDHLEANLGVFSFQLGLDDMEELGAATKPEAQRGDCGVAEHFLVDEIM